jgi:hypothetical protein
MLQKIQQVLRSIQQHMAWHRAGKAAQFPDQTGNPALPAGNRCAARWPHRLTRSKEHLMNRLWRIAGALCIAHVALLLGGARNPV